jgi:DNA-binding CsgD family transcriptional regulator
MELYPSVLPRLQAILASKDPHLRRRAAAFRRAAQVQEIARLGRLADAYRLSRAEARLALHIVEGGDIASYAKSVGVRVGTARSQLKAVFAKTGVSRQAELVRLGLRIL